jgi:hypothetical protein
MRSQDETHARIEPGGLFGYGLSLRSSLKTLQRATRSIDVYLEQLELKLYRPRVGGVYNRPTILHVTTYINLHASQPLNQKVLEGVYSQKKVALLRLN